jgi:thiol-disulfide isomerase/thioredoxin
MTWIKGQPVTRFEPGHVYVVEFWATWCGPCAAAMPHLSELQKKYAGRLTVVGVDAREADAGKADVAAVNAFVKKKGDQMAYTVAMDDPVKKTVFGEGLSKAAYQLAADSLRKTADSDPDDFMSRQALAKAHYRLGNFKEAIAAQEAAIAVAHKRGYSEDYVSKLKQALADYQNARG